MNKFRSAFAIASGILFSGCLTTTDIRLNPDHSAHVTTSNYGVDSFFLCRSSYFKSELITNLDSVVDSLEIKYDIKTIDSLGNYLYCEFNKGFFRFNYRNDTLIYSDGNGPPCPVRTHFPCWHTCIIITSDRKIKSVGSHHLHVKKRGNSVYITKKGTRYNRPSKSSQLIIVYE